LRHVERAFQAAGDGVRHGTHVFRLQQDLGPAVELVGDGFVFRGQAHQVVHAQFQRLVFVAQHFHLAFLQRDGAAGQWAGQLDFPQQLGVLFEEMRMSVRYWATAWNPVGRSLKYLVG
jgi:hypothetical protein